MGTAVREHSRRSYSDYHTSSNTIHSNPLAGKRICIARNKPQRTIQLYGLQRSRSFVTNVLPSFLVPPAIFVGLLLSLWAWKCFWIIVLQDKLLYLSWLPPLSRSEKIEDYQAQCRPVQWVEKPIRSLDGTKLAVCEGRIPVRGPDGFVAHNVSGRSSNRSTRKKSVVICYFQGNGGSTPLRLPLLSQILRTIAEKSKSTCSSPTDDVDYTVVALSYRGYWTSSGRATQSGIELDAQAFLDWVSETYATPDADLQVILWGHSLGSAIASNATASYLSRHSGEKPPGDETRSPVNIAGLILEAPSSSIKDMLISLYPQRWLPYRYLWPFSWNHWSCTAAMERMAQWRDLRSETSPKNSSGAPEPPESESSSLAPRSISFVPPILLVSAQNDEVIPPHVADGLEADGKRLRLNLERKDVTGALHTEALLKIDGREAMVNFIFKSTSRNRRHR
ncbi:hypothetical protein BBP40_003127 [Aspergillus hancockii]|nr:hypothetical protein BBP40_003127 [Aspergillus hancockii]